MHTDVFCEVAVPDKHNNPEVGNSPECFAALSVTTSVGWSLLLPLYTTPFLSRSAGGLLNFTQFCKLLDKQSLIFSMFVLWQVMYYSLPQFTLHILDFLKCLQCHILGIFLLSKIIMLLFPPHFIPCFWPEQNKMSCAVSGLELHVCWLDWLVCDCSVAWALSQWVCLKIIFSLFFPQ